jgi:cell division protein FtsZ
MNVRKYLTFGQGASKMEGDLKPVVRIVGVGGAGCNIVDSGMDLGIRHAEAIAINTDAQNLHSIRCRKILIGKDITRGRGASSDPQIGETAAMADLEKIRPALAGTEVLFLISGLGGGTGTGAAPIVARLAHKMGAFVVALTVHPFKAEGDGRNRRARLGLESLRNAADVVVMVQNDKLVQDFPDMKFQEALTVADHLLLAPVKAITQLLTKDDLPNLRTVLGIRDIACLGFGEANVRLGPRSVVKDAVDSLMPQGDISAHDRALAVIHCPPGYRDDELHRFIQELHLFIHEGAEIMWGPIVDPSLEEEIRIMTIVGRARACPPPENLPGLEAAGQPGPEPLRHKDY